MNEVVDLEHEFHNVKWNSPIGILLQKDRRHVGLVVINEDETDLQFIHLAGENSLENDQLKCRQAFLVYTGLDRERELNLAAFCRKVWKRNNGSIPYGFSYPNEALDKRTGQFLIGKSKLGLTCASFVLAVFHSCGIPLVALQTWPIFDAGDIKTQQFFLDYMRSRGIITPEQHDARKIEIGNSRVTPSEVAALTAFRPYPHTFRSLYAKAAQFFAKIGISDADFNARKAAARHWMVELSGWIWCRLKRN